MEILHTAVCEDNLDEQKNVLAILQKSEIPTETTLYCCGEDFLKEYQQGKFDLVFMDIYMDGISGLDVVTRLREIGDNVPVAFITTSTEHTLESYRLDALKYIEKPLKERAVLELLEFAQLKKEHTPRLLLKKNGRDFSLPFERILYVEQKDHTLYLYLVGGEIVQVKERMDLIEPQFDEQPFFRCHKSYLVNLSYVAKLDRELMVFVMKEGQNVHIRRQSMSKARKAFESYLFAETRRLGNE